MLNTQIFKQHKNSSKLSYLGTRLQNSSNPVRYSLHFDEKKTVSAHGTCSGLTIPARTCMSREAAHKRKRLIVQYSGFLTCYKFRNELMSTEVPLYFIHIYSWIFILGQRIYSRLDAYI